MTMGENEESTSSAKETKKVETKTVETPAGDRIQYLGSEKAIAFLLSIYLIAMFFSSLWFLGDVFIGNSGVVRWIFWYVKQLPFDITLVQLTMGGGWLGGTLSAVNSLQSHYAAVVENVGNLDRQERERFHLAWWHRWFWGPWMGTGLALLVYALVHAGVLVFTATPTSANPTPWDKFASIGLGGLVGLGAKDVIEKLNQVLKTWLRMEEPKVKSLEIKPAEKDVSYGDAVRFEIIPKIPVNWDITPNDQNKIGTLANGVFRAVGPPAGEALPSQTVVITAASKSDPDRAASAILRLGK